MMWSVRHTTYMYVSCREVIQAAYDVRHTTYMYVCREKQLYDVIGKYPVERL